MNNKATGEFVLSRRKELGMTQMQLAENLNLTDKAISKWEHGKSAPAISSLIPLAEALEVSVVEILKGKKMEKEEVQNVSDTTIVETMKESRNNVLKGIVCAVVVLFLLFSIYPIYQFCTTVSVKDEAGVEKMANDYLNRYTMKMVQCVQKGDYLAVLLENESGNAVVLFRRNRIFKERYEIFSRTGPECDFGKIELHCIGQNGITINVFFGTKIPEEFSQYKFGYRGTEVLCPIENQTVLDVFLDVNESFSNAYDIELIK